MPAEDSGAIDATIQLVTKEMGELDVIICNAGICLHVNATVQSFRIKICRASADAT